MAELMRIGKFDFRPRPAMSVATLFLLVAFLSLSGWQLQRAAEKERMMEEWSARSAAEPVRLARIEGDLDSMQYRSAELVGAYGEAHQYLLDSQVRDGEVGFHVLTPFRLASGERVLVNRGWVPKANRSEPAPDIAPPEVNRVRGTLAPPPGVALRLGPPSAPDAGWPRPIQYVDLDRIADTLESKIAPYTLVLDENQPGAFTRDWHLMTSGPGTHYGYALQWLAFAILLMALYGGLNLKRPGDGDSEDAGAQDE